MNNTLKSEFKKVLTVRSTYILFALAILIPALTNFFTGYKTHSSLYNPNNYDSHAYIQAFFAAAAVAGVFLSLIGLLLICHEYRYRTIVYTLTNINGRTKVIFAKLLVVWALGLLMTVLVLTTGFAAFLLGVHMQHISFPAQTINYGEVFVRCAYFILGYGAVGLIFGALVRNLVGAIAVLFIVPGTIEGLIGLIIKGENQYLPFTSIKQVVIDPGQVPPNLKLVQTDHPLRSAVTFLIYLILGWLITWYLFIKRDAIKD